MAYEVGLPNVFQFHLHDTCSHHTVEASSMCHHCPEIENMGNEYKVFYFTIVIIIAAISSVIVAQQTSTCQKGDKVQLLT